MSGNDMAHGLRRSDWDAMKAERDALRVRVSELEAALLGKSLTAYSQGVEDCKAAIRRTGHHSWEGAQFKPYFITEIARTCSPHQYQARVLDQQTDLPE